MLMLKISCWVGVILIFLGASGVAVSWIRSRFVEWEIDSLGEIFVPEEEKKRIPTLENALIKWKNISNFCIVLGVYPGLGIVAVIVATSFFVLPR
jgi:hypothetical protein